jgi:hypothetical protein
VNFTTALANRHTCASEQTLGMLVSPWWASSVECNLDPKES